LLPFTIPFFRAQSTPMGPLSVRPERPWPSNINGMYHKKRLFSVQEEREKKREKKVTGRREFLLEISQHC